MNKEDLRLRSWYGEGYYSGASSMEVLVYDINDKKLLNDECEFFKEEERYLGELDGKHSQVYGTKYEWDDDDFVSIVKNYQDADEDVFDSEFYREEDSDVYRALKKAHDFVVKFGLKEIFRNKETGDILNMLDYEKDYIVVEK